MTDHLAVVHHAAVSRLVKSEPRLLLFEGRLIPAARKNESVTKDELHAVLRAQAERAAMSVGSEALMGGSL